MEHSAWGQIGRKAPGRTPRGPSILLGIADVAAYLTLPASLLALGRGQAQAALAAAAAGTALSFARAFLIGQAVQGALVGTWRFIVETARAHSVVELRRRREESVNVAVLFEAAQQTAMYSAVVIPELVARAVALVAVTAATIVLLGPAWVAVGAIALLPPVLVSLAARRRLARAQNVAWSTFGAIGRDLRVLLEASLELRAHGRESAFAAQLLARIDEMASAERTVHAYSAVIGLLPASLTLLVVATPVRAGVDWITTVLVGPRMAEVGILGATAAVLGLGLARSIESSLRAAPARQTLGSFLAEISQGARASERRAAAGDPGSLALAEIHFDGVSAVYAGSDRATPERFDHRWASRRGLAVTGDNGTGKTTLALMLLGLVEPASGVIRVGGAPIGDLSMDGYRARVAYVPQDAFFDDGSSVGWHLRLVLGPDLDPARVESVLRRVGLHATLTERAKHSRIATDDVLAGELSGGERRRLLLARALLQDAELLIFDEPEAGLDRDARSTLVEILQDLAQTRRVLLIAHDESVIPPSFERVACVASAV